MKKAGEPCADLRSLSKRVLRRLTPEQVARCRDPDEIIRALAAEFGVSPTTIFFVRHRYTYKDLP
jgi:hypothetical protein